MANNYIYVVRNNGVVISTAITVIQIKAGAAKALEILRATVSQRATTTSVLERLGIVRKSAAATVTSATPLLYNGTGGDPAAAAAGGTAATGITASVEGTDGDILHDKCWNIAGGEWNYEPPPESRPLVVAGGIIGLKFLTAPASSTWYAEILFRELG